MSSRRNDVIVGFPDDDNDWYRKKVPHRINIWGERFIIPPCIRNMISELKDTIISLLKDRWDDDDDFTCNVK